MKHLFILNPVAGKNGSAMAIESRIRSYCNDNTIDYTVHVSKSGEDILNVCNDIVLSGVPTRIYACGGDGTLNKVVNGCAGAANIEVGVIPVGTGNDFVKACRLPEENFFSIEKQVNGVSKKIDLIKYNNSFCINICNMGFDANVGIDMPKYKKLPFVSHHLAYYLSLLVNFLKKWGREMEVYADGELLYKGDTMMVAVSNGISCGGGFFVTPRAAIDDGFIDVSAVSPPPKKNIFKLVGYYQAGTQLEHEELFEYIHYKKCKSVDVFTPVEIGMLNDGDRERMTHTHYEIAEGVLSFIFPE